MSEKEDRDRPRRDDEPHDERAEAKGHRRIPGLSTARRLVSEPGAGFREAKEVLGAVLDTSDRAKTEGIRMIGREVRTYLEGLGLKDDLKSLLTNYSFEIRASIHLKPLAEEDRQPRKPSNTAEKPEKHEPPES
ncbi:MAG: hypothetical protein IPO67_06415 [Deltaproteobacteria bacterium]|nr:hypothetical protein [Deltaproteobacteria bacterium]MBK9644772.1 hypothetical protein [Deltaproteobacteria bacterium]